MRRLLLLMLLLPVGGCGSSPEAADAYWTPTAAPDLGAIVGRVGQVPIFASQVLAEAKRSGKGVREAFDDLLAMHLLAERARGSGWRPIPSSDVEVKSALVQRLLERDFEPLLRPESVPDGPLRQIYERAINGFVHPRLVDVGVLAVYTGVLMKEKPRQERARTAEELAVTLQQRAPKTLDEFAAIARDPAWSSRHVVYLRVLQSEERPFPKRIGKEMTKLQSDGDTTPLLSDVDGFYIARYAGERPPENVSFEQARDKLLEGFIDTWRRQQFQEYTNRLMQAHKTVAYFDRLNEQGP